MGTIAVLIILGLTTAGLLVAAIRVKAPAPIEAQYGRTPKQPPNVKPFIIGAFVASLLLSAVVTFLQSFKVIGANEVGVPVTFGKAAAAIGPGPHFVKPWTDITKYPTRPETFTTVAQARTNQQGQAAVRITGRWSTTKADALELFKQQRQGADKIESNLIDPQAQGAVGAYYGGLDNTTAVNGQSWIKNATGTQLVLADYLLPYGIHVDQLRVLEVNPTDETNRAIARVAAQKLETTVATESVATAGQQALQQKKVAQGQADAAAKVSKLSPTEVQVLCLQAAERLMNKNAEKGIATYVLPCQAGGSSVIAK